jgi:TetR/AcrR family transcriptional regulator, transcriptional repressor for nem operon
VVSYVSTATDWSTSVPRETNSRADLLEQGTQLMLRSGYAGTGLVELLQAAGVPKGSFYNHFGSKEAFGVAVVLHYYGWHDRLLTSLTAESDRSPLERLRSYFERLLERAVDASPQVRGCLMGMLALEMAGSSEPLRASVSDAFRRWQARLAELLRQAQVAGELAPEHDPQPLAAMLIESWEGALMRARASRDLDALRSSLDLLFSRLPSTEHVSSGHAVTIPTAPAIDQRTSP